MIRALLLLSVLFTFTPASRAAERERFFRRGRIQGPRGNENSLRIGRVPLGALQFAGNGCPAGTMRVVFAPDSLSFSVIFDQFVAEVKNGDRLRRDLIVCDALVPVQLPANMRMEITRVDYRGFSALPAGAVAELHSILNFWGPRGDLDRLNLRFRFTGPVTENYELSSDVITNGDTEVSPCGGAVVLRLRNQLRVVSRSKEASSVTLDSIDGAGHATYQVNWTSCQAPASRTALR